MATLGKSIRYERKRETWARCLGNEINSAVFPGRQGATLMHVFAAKAVAFYEALRLVQGLSAKRRRQRPVVAETLEARG